MDNEKDLTDAIQDNLNEAVDSVSLEAQKVVELIAAYLADSDPSSEFLFLLEKYRVELDMRAECAYSQRCAQRIQSAVLRKDGIYYLEDSWGKQIQGWLDENISEAPILESMDDIYNIAPKGKPTKKWTAKVNEVFSGFTEQHVLEVIRILLTFFVESDEVLKTGIWSDNERKLKQMVLILTLNKHEEDAELLRKLAVVSYTKVPWEGPVSTGVGNLCIQMLSDLPGTQGLVYLSELASQLKYPKNAVSLAKHRLEEAAKSKGVTVNQLQSMSVPDYGLED